MDSKFKFGHFLQVKMIFRVEKIVVQEAGKIKEPCSLVLFTNHGPGNVAKEDINSDNRKRRLYTWGFFSGHKEGIVWPNNN